MKWSAEAYSFLFGEANHLDAEGKPSSLQLFQQRNGKHNSEDAVISTGVRNSIEVRSDQEARSVGLRGRINPAEISCGIDSHVAPSGSIHRAISWWQSRMGGDKKRPADAASVFGKRCQSQAPCDDFVSASCGHSCWHWILFTGNKCAPDGS